MLAYTSMKVPHFFFMRTKQDAYIGIKIHRKFSLVITHNMSMLKREFYSGKNIQFRCRK